MQSPRQLLSYVGVYLPACLVSANELFDYPPASEEVDIAGVEAVGFAVTLWKVLVVFAVPVVRGALWRLIEFPMSLALLTPRPPVLALGSGDGDFL